MFLNSMETFGGGKSALGGVYFRFFGILFKVLSGLRLVREASVAVVVVCLAFILVSGVWYSLLKLTNKKW